MRWLLRGLAIAGGGVAGWLLSWFLAAAVVLVIPPDARAYWAYPAALAMAGIGLLAGIVGGIVVARRI